MKNLLKIVVLSLAMINLNANYYKARDWYNRYAKYQTNEVTALLQEYAFCRVQEIDYTLRMERKDLTNLEYEIANEGFKKSINLKNLLTYKMGSTVLIDTLRNEANKIANEKFTEEILKSFLIQYKTGKRAAARTAKRDFYFECYKLLKRRSVNNPYNFNF